jgi:two-component system OmpR family response regulator
MTVLLIEDDKKIASFIIKGLNESSFHVEHVEDGNLAYQSLMENQYHAAIVDILLPGMDGLTLVEKIRQNGINTPILFLSAKRDVDDRVKGLQIGGDDYLTKPFSFTELLERLRAIIRRTTGQTDFSILRAGDLEIDTTRHRITRQGREIELNNLEFRLIAYLAQNKGRVVSKTSIMEKVWDYYFDPQTNVVEATVCRLRNKLNNGFDEKLIKTIRGVGYVLECSE